jgi:hypothetical protein
MATEIEPIDLSIVNYEIWISPDSMPYAAEPTSYRTWFLFSVTGVPKGVKTLNFLVKNMSN